MYWANFLHIYQPPDQLFDILERVVNESYRKLFRGLKENPRAKITLNINAGLTEQLAQYKYQDVLDNIKFLAERGQIEFTESAKYHPFLPLVPKEEIIRQIKLNQQTNQYYFGKVYQPKGFFPPEMGYSRKIAEVVAKLGYEWIIIDEIAYNGRTEVVPYDQVYTIKGLKNFKVFFRERRISNLIMSAVVRSGQSLLEAMHGEEKKNRYLLTAMDGETFGHHRPGLDKLLFQIFKSDIFQKITISEIPRHFPQARAIEPINSTWSTTEQEIQDNVVFNSWRDPKNPIHQWQWDFTNWINSLVNKLDPRVPNYKKIRGKMDKALHSCQFWWASGKPWWSLEMIEGGAWKVLEIAKILPGLSKKDLKMAEDYYQKIVLRAFEWQRTGYIRKLAQQMQSQIKIPFKERTLGTSKAHIYHAFLKLMEVEMKKAAKNKEYEKAVLWRDAITKIEEKNDIYDAVHVTDLLRMTVPHDKLESLIIKYKEKYKKMRAGQPEQRNAL